MPAARQGAAQSSRECAGKCASENQTTQMHPAPGDCDAAEQRPRNNIRTAEPGLPEHLRRFGFSPRSCSRFPINARPNLLPRPVGAVPSPAGTSPRQPAGHTVAPPAQVSGPGQAGSARAEVRCRGVPLCIQLC